VKTLPQHSFHCSFPARVDAQLLEEPRQPAERMAVEPVAQRRVVLGIGLNLAQGPELRLCGGLVALGRVQRFARGGAHSLCIAIHPRPAWRAVTPGQTRWRRVR